MAEKIYVFDTSRGAGVPGLPHEVTEEQAQALGLADVLKAAIANGSYKLKNQPVTVEEPAVSRSKKKE